MRSAFLLRVFIRLIDQADVLAIGGKMHTPINIW